MRVFPWPEEEERSRDFGLTVEGRDCVVLVTRVAPRDRARRFRAMDDKRNSGAHFETASFAAFDMRGPVLVAATCREEVRMARVLPTSAGITPVVRGRSVTLAVAEPRPLTVEVNGEDGPVLHLFANPFEEDVPDPRDPSVWWFGPGIHDVERLVAGDGRTIYVAGGAVLRCGVGPAEESTVSVYSGLRNYAPSIELRGRGVTLRGRGIVDGSRCPTHARCLLAAEGRDLAIDGVILRDASHWTLPIRRSDHVTVRNVKFLGHRANSDGIDVVNSRDVTVEGCFLRTLDDLVVVKTDRGGGPAERIAVRRCVLWNEVAHALSIGAETSEDVSGVLFADCDVIRDRGREWTLRIYHGDSAEVRDVRFEDIRIEESRRAISLFIGKTRWSRDAGRGRIRGVVFRNVRLPAGPLRIELTGHDEAHMVEDVTFDDVTVGGAPLRPDAVTANAHVCGVILYTGPPGPRCDPGGRHDGSAPAPE
ncbi:MAG: glycosyl hydrolase family 28 protein [Planctomycetes bacterium]|nr:glycosyl hydrolase family 28 protein [Planctomycetota bacterium]